MPNESQPTNTPSASSTREAHVSELPKDNALVSGSLNPTTLAQATMKKRGRRVRTPEQIAVDDAEDAHRISGELLKVARAKLIASKFTKEYEAGFKLMHSLLLEADQTSRDGVLSMFIGMADKSGQAVLQTYLDALNAVPPQA